MDAYLEFASKHTLLVSCLVLSFLMVLFVELRRKASGMINIAPEQAVTLINNDAVVIDLRSPDAYAGGHIVNARNIPMEDLNSDSKKLDKWKSKPIVAVCQTGITSTKAIHQLQKQGFESVYGVKGGIAAWSQAGLPLVTGKKTATKKKHKNKG